MTDQVQVEARSRIRDAGYRLETGDRVTVSMDLARYWAGNGWAAPVAEGTGIEVRAKVPGAKRIDPHAVINALPAEG